MLFKIPGNKTYIYMMQIQAISSYVKKKNVTIISGWLFIMLTLYVQNLLLLKHLQLSVYFLSFK